MRGRLAVLAIAGSMLTGCLGAEGDPGPSSSVTEDHGDGTTGAPQSPTPDGTPSAASAAPVTADPATGRCSDPIATVPTGAVGAAPIQLEVTGLVAVDDQGARRWADVVVYADGSAARYDGGFADPWAYAPQRQLATVPADHGDRGAEALVGGYLDCDLAGLLAAIELLERDQARFGGAQVAEASDTEMILHGQDGTEEFVWDVHGLGLERDDAGVVVAGLDAEQLAARDALSAFAAMLISSVVDARDLPVDRIEVLAPYAITDEAVTWPAPPITEVLHDGCGVVEGAAATALRDQVQAGTPIADPAVGVYLRVLAPQVEPCIVHQ
ncbi:hypothetical protein EXU48_08640 [Occultella glacieicola]|uniref:Uncharacterized protein n=1 Tax=Occultella glacieicola TaxID=2518684 RepID=A0ABY2E494_9MICO|nr:hypothetical protein [Occultella glacieicola]TDE94850.1 hypothetical protein EXU48_08640 [Occultella glacieicola]